MKNQLNELNQKENFNKELFLKVADLYQERAEKYLKLSNVMQDRDVMRSGRYYESLCKLLKKSTDYYKKSAEYRSKFSSL